MALTATVARPRSHHRQVSMPSLRSGAVSPRSRTTHGSYSDRQNHYVQESEISCASSVFSTSLGDDTDWYNNDTFYPVEEEERLVDGSYTESRASCSPPMISSPPTIRHSRKSTLTRHSSLRLSKDNGNENHFANVINRYTQSRQSNSSYRNIIGDLLKSAAVDKSYKPKVVGHASMIPSPKLSMPHSAKKPTRSLSMRSYKSKVISDKQKIPSPKSLPRRHHGTAPVVVERSEFDNLTGTGVGFAPAPFGLIFDQLSCLIFLRLLMIFCLWIAYFCLTRIFRHSLYSHEHGFLLRIYFIACFIANLGILCVQL